MSTPADQMNLFPGLTEEGLDLSQFDPFAVPKTDEPTPPGTPPGPPSATPKPPGQDVFPIPVVTPPPAAPTPAPAPTPSSQQELEALRAEVRALQQQMQTTPAPTPTPAGPPPAAPTVHVPTNEEIMGMYQKDPAVAMQMAAQAYALRYIAPTLQAMVNNYQGDVQNVTQNIQATQREQLTARVVQTVNAVKQQLAARGASMPAEVEKDIYQSFAGASLAQGAEPGFIEGRVQAVVGHALLNGRIVKAPTDAHNPSLPQSSAGGDLTPSLDPRVAQMTRHITGHQIADEILQRLSQPIGISIGLGD